MTDSIPIDFEGRSIAARKGESVMAALVGAGVLAFRSTRTGADRGPFCGMGVCQDCLIDVDGVPNQRACMTTVKQPMTVRRESHCRPLPDAPPAVAGTLAVKSPDLLIVGAGPGGLSAAIAARRAGVGVVIVDERSTPGGQYFKQRAVSGDDVAPADAQHREGAALIAEARAAGVDIRSGTLVWGAFAPAEFTTTGPDGATRWLPRATIIATGAYERPWPVPGWTLPGVMTTGAAQTLWRTARRLPGRRVLIAGNGPLNLQLCAELLSGGAEVAAVLEAAPAPSPGNAGALLTMMATSPALVRDGIAYHARRRRGGTPMRHGQVIAGIERHADGSLTALAHPSGERFIVDAVCLGYGFEPSSELLRALGCGHDFDAAAGQRVVRRDVNGLTDMPGIYAIGDCTGIGGARVALAEGTVVGIAAATSVGGTMDAGTDRLRRKAAQTLARHRRFQRALWQVYAAPPRDIAALANADTVLCRCEEVTLGTIMAALDEGDGAIGSVKRRTRAGMGACQGRYCAPVIETLLAAHTGRPRDEFSGFAPRVPARPVSIAELAARADD
jgi:thioredoxin reductase